MKKMGLSNGWIVPVALFAGGALFHVVAMPVLDALSNLAQQAAAKKIVKWNMDVEQAQCEHEAACEIIKPNNNNVTQAIGFQVGGDDDSYED